VRYRFLALDIDGTLVRPHENEVRAKVINAIEKAKEFLQISLISARSWKDQEIIVKKLGLENSYHAIENGAKVVNPQGEIENSNTLTKHESDQIIDLARDFMLDFGICINGEWLSESKSSDEISTLSLISENLTSAEEIITVIEKLPEQYSITVGDHWSNSEWKVTLVSSRNASKGKGLEYIQNRLGIKISETIVVGDGASDIPAMQYAGLKVAMGNSEKVMLDIADYTAPSVEDDGVVKVIEKFVIN
jgi:HAD superfamily hydrolase (TIGR01484 family)